MKILQGQTGGRIIFDAEDWTNGLAVNWGVTGAPNVLGGNQISGMSAINPFRRWGVPLPGYRPSAATNNSQVSEYLRKGIVNATSVTIVSNGPKIQRFDGISVISTTAPFPYTVTPTAGATPIGNDCVIYGAKVGGSTTITQNFFYSYSSSTIWEIGMYDLNTTFDDDFMSSAAVTTPLATPYTTGGGGVSGGNVVYPHPLIVGDDDIMYAGDRNFLHAYDGVVNSAATLGKFYPAVLTLPSGWIITSFEKTDDGLMIFSYYSTVTNDNYRGQARAWLWKYGELDITRSYNLNDNFTGESFTVGTTIGIFTNGRIADYQNTSKRSKIQLFDGTRFKPEVAFVGALPCRGGVEVTGDSVKWNSAGVIYSYGGQTLGIKTGLNKIGVTTNGTESGMLGTFLDSSNVMAVSSGTTSAGGLETLSTNFEGTVGTSNCFLITALAEPIFPKFFKGRITCVTMEMSNTVTPASSTELSVIVCDRINNQQTILSQHTQVTTAAEQMIKREKDTSGADLMAFDGLALLLQYTRQSGTASQSFGPTRVIVDYENRSIKT